MIKLKIIPSHIGVFVFLILACITLPVSAATTQQNPKAPTVLSRVVLPSTELMQVGDQFAVLKEKKAFGRYSMTVIDNRTIKVVKNYQLLLPGFGWDSWNLTDDKHVIVRRLINKSGKQYYNYRVDVLTGKIDYLPITSVDSEIIAPPQSFWGRDTQLKIRETKNNNSDYNGIFIRDGESFKITKINSRQTFELGKAEVTKPCGWNPAGTHYAYVKGNNLALYSVENLKPVTVTNIPDKGEMPIFLAWTPDGNGCLFVENNILKLFKLDGTTKELGPFKPVLEGPPESPAVVQWNPGMNKAVLQDQTDKMYVFDVTTEEAQVLSKPKSDLTGTYGTALMDVFWNMDGTEIQFLSYRVLGKMQSTNDDLYIRVQQGGYIQVPLNNSDGFSYYKGNLVFLTDIEMMGTFDKFYHSLGIYDFKTGELHLIPQVGGYEIIGDRLLVYKDMFSEECYLVNEKTWTLQQKLTAQLMAGIEINGKKLGRINNKNGTVTITSYDIKSGQSKVLLTFGKNEQFYLNSNNKIVALYVPARKRVYFYNGNKLSSVGLTGTLVPDYAAPVFDDNNYYLLENVKGKVSFKMGRIPF